MRNPFTYIVLIVGIFWGCTGIKKHESAVSLHFSLNDSLLQNPIALIFYEGNYHLFYKYTIDGESAKWGKTLSPDLNHWNNSQMKFGSDQDDFQDVKSVVVDWNHTTEFGLNTPALIALATSADQLGELTVLYSEDEGASWQQYSDEPIILENFYEPIRDLKVFWNEDQQRWSMLVLSGYEVRFYSSDNLRNWEYISRFGDDVYLKYGEWTSLDFFPMEVAESDKVKWVLFISADSGSPNEGSGVQYFVGDFDGYVYQASHNKPKWIDHGSDLYQAVVLADYLVSNKAPVLIGSIYNSIYTKLGIHTEESGVFSLARQLSLAETFHDYYLVSEPLGFIETIKKERHSIGELELTDGKLFEKNLKLPLEISLTFDVNNRLYLGMAETFGVKIKNNEGEELILGYQAERRYFFIVDPAVQKDFPDTWDGFNYAPYVTNGPLLDMKLVVDKNSAELFAMNGLVSLSRKFEFSDEWDQVQVFAEKGRITLKEGIITEFKR